MCCQMLICVAVHIVGLLRDLIRHYQIGEHLLLIGNQGVGKNKVHLVM